MIGLDDDDEKNRLIYKNSSGVEFNKIVGQAYWVD